MERYASHSRGNISVNLRTLNPLHGADNLRNHGTCGAGDLASFVASLAVSSCPRVKIAFLLLLSGNLFCPIAAERTAEQRLSEYLASKTEIGSVFAQGTLDGVDYRKFLRGAIAKDSVALSALIRYTTNGKLMGEGAESNCDILRQLLRLWGDKPFARVLAAESPKVRTAVVAAIDYAWPHPGWQPRDFPVTYRLADHD